MILPGRSWLPAAALGSAIALAGAAGAEVPICPSGNLLAGRLPLGAPPALAVITDGQVTPEGAVWNAKPAFVLDRATPALTWDLGAVVVLRALVVQADGNDLYPISGSTDGVAFAPLVEVSPVDPGLGLRTRALRLAERPVRFLRLAASAGDGAYAVSELAAFCAVPSPWPPVLTRVEAPLEGSGTGTRLGWNDVTSRWWELLLALLGLALLVAGRLSGRDRGGSRVWDRLLALGGVVALLTFFNFGAFHFGNYVHAWDTFHYYTGAKYFRELGYERLYECVAVADALEPGLATRVAERKITNLRTNVLESSAEILAHPERCTAHFSPARWAAFRHDVAWFRGRETAERWEGVLDRPRLQRHAGVERRRIAARQPRAGERPLHPRPDRRSIRSICSPSRRWWAGLSVGAPSRSRCWSSPPTSPAASSGPAAPSCAGTGSSTPSPRSPACAGGSPCSAAWRSATRRCCGSSPACWRSVRRWGWRSRWRAGCAPRPEPGGAPRSSGPSAASRRAPTCASSPPPGSPPRCCCRSAPPSRGGADAYRGFVANTLKHKSTPLTNAMGLRTVVTYRPAEVGRHLVSDAAADPWRRWKEARVAAWERSRGVAGVILLGVVALVGLAVARHGDPWLAAALGVIVIPFAVELTSYYYAFLIVPALLWSCWRWSGPLLLALCAFTQFVSLAPLPGMSTWRDEQYTWISLATLIALSILLVRFASGPTPRDEAEAAPPVP